MMAKQLDSFWVRWDIALIAALLLSALASRFAYFPGDVEITRFLQSLLPRDLGWAQVITNTARSPWNFALLVLTGGVSWALAGWRAAALAIASFAVMLALGPWMQNLIERPRPSPTLVRVAGASSGYSFPSIFALTYASTFGYLLLLARAERPASSGGLGRFVTISCSSLLIIGGVARIVLGAHWPSDVLAGYLIGFVWAALLIRLIRK
ncbi:MAG: phosphatase PAP2 family protein [Blastocatellia bacterium]